MDLDHANPILTNTAEPPEVQRMMNDFRPEHSLGTFTASTRLGDSLDLPRASAGPDEPSTPDDPSMGTTTIAEPKSRTKTPPMYRVILMNDDYTPMDFVIHVLQKFFNKDSTEATKIMLQVHHQGAGVCGVFSYEIAETKVYQVNQYARQNRHPLKCVMEKA